MLDAGAVGAISNTEEVFSSLFGTFWVLGIAVSIIVFGLIGYLLIRYRDRGTATPEPEDAPQVGKVPGRRGKLRNVVISVSLSTILLGVLVFGTFAAIDTIGTPPTEATLQQSPLEVTVVGFQWAWEFQYPNGKTTVGQLRVPVGEVVILDVTSRDVFHDFGIIEFKIKKDAIPGVTNTIWFVARQPGTFTIQCFEFCGLGHAGMIADLIAMEPADFRAWYEAVET